MITKTQACWIVVNDHFGIDNPHYREDDILKSSQLAVAMEYLGLLYSDWAKDYARSRGGVLLCGICCDPKVKENLGATSFSFRNLLSLLPD